MTKETASELGFDDELEFQLSRAERWNAFLNERLLGMMVYMVAIKVHSIVMKYWSVLCSWSRYVRRNGYRNLRTGN